MTAPVPSGIIWATLKVNQEGFSFAVVASTNGTAAQSTTRVLLPRGVNQIIVDWMGQSRAIIQAGTSAALQKVEIPAAASGTRRTVHMAVPANAPDAYINVTTYTNATTEVGQIMGGIRIFPTQ